jgi:glutaconyl-CoA/methylmalonyl-CoA decarboxylase subunit gamma
MKYSVKVGEKTYNVEIEDIHARPVIAQVDGDRFEVMPENGIQTGVQNEARKIKSTTEKKPVAPNPTSAASSVHNPAISGNIVTAPLPGTVVEIFVKVGDKVEAGQVLLVIEAMKMKNSIRSMWSGTIGDVMVNVGQTVAHKQAMIKFADLGEASWM